MQTSFLRIVLVLYCLDNTCLACLGMFHEPSSELFHNLVAQLSQGPQGISPEAH
jgi:hypothetical protein